MILQALLVLPILWVLAACFGPVKAWEKRQLSLAERLIFRAALGLGAFSYLIFALGIAGQFNRTAFILLFAALVLLSLPGQRDLLREFRRRDSSARPASFFAGDSQSRYFQAICLLGIAVLALLMVFGCASPPTGLDWDGLSYHLADPKIYLEHGRIFYIPWEHHSNFPFLTEMLYAFGLAFHAVALSKAFHLATGLLTAAGLCAFYLRFSGDSEIEAAPGSHRPVRRASLLPAALFLGAPLVFWEGTVAYADLAATLYAFLALYAFAAALYAPLRPDGEEQAADRAAASLRWLLISGIMLGFAIGAKTTNGIFLILLLLWGTWAAAKGAIPKGASLKALLAFLVPAALLAAPWFLKSLLYTGNPVYPFFYGVFGGKNWNAQLARVYEQEQAGFGRGRSLASLILLLWNLTFHATDFSKGIGQFASLGPYALGLTPLLALARRLPRWTKAFLLLALGFLTIWVMLTQQIRYLLPLYPALCLAAAYAGEHAAIGRLGRMGAAAFVGASLALTVLYGALYVQPMIPVALGAMSQEEYLSRYSQLEPAARFVNLQLPKSAKLLLLEETRGFDFNRPYMWGNPGHHALIPWDDFKTPEEMTRWLAEHGFTHVLLNLRWMRPGWGSSPWEATVNRAIQEGLLRPVFNDSERKVVIFEIKEARGSSS